MFVSQKYLIENSFPDTKDIDSERKKKYRPTVLIVPCCGEKYLMFKSKEYDNWQFPQGGILNKENIKKACEREIIEEVGKRFWDLTEKEIRYIGSFTNTLPEEKHGDRRLQTDSGENVTMIGKTYYICKLELSDIYGNIEMRDSEFSECKWVSRDEGLKISDEIHGKQHKAALNMF